MTTNDYINELKKKLESLDSKIKENILKEIKSYIEEQELSYETLVEKFGSVNDLAASYLEDNPIIELKWYKKKRFYIIFSIISLIIVFIYFMQKDPFDYSLYNESTINKKVEVKWLKLENIEKLDFVQSKVVIYSSSKDYLEYSCNKDKRLISNVDNILRIKQKHCFIKVPNSVKHIKSYQSNIVFIQVKDSININLDQSTLTFSEKGNSYTYDIKSYKSNYEDLISKDSNVKIKIDLIQSNASYYSY